MKILLIVIFTFSLNSVWADATAAKKVAEEDPSCKAIGPFYWEIGNKDSILASGSPGGTVDRSTVFAIASASKWIFGAYVIEKLQGKIDPATSKALHMTSGYTSMPPLSCIMQSTVGGCFQHGDNSQFTAANENHFFYNGAHFQKWAVDHGLGNMGRQELTAEYKKVLGSDLQIEFKVLQPAGGIRTSAAGYAAFLQKILKGQLKIRDHLGEAPVCTLKSTCPDDAISSPVPLAWHYSNAHWVEDTPGEDGAFSSAGAFGFYPWIDKSKTYYGVISKHDFSRDAETHMGRGHASAICGQNIRRAFFAR